MKKMKIALFAALALFMSSCAHHYGSYASSASLSAPNFSYAKQRVQGTASVSYFMGMGGFKHAALIEAANADLLKKNPLQANQALANVVVDFKGSAGFLTKRNRCTVTADIVTFK